MIALDASALAYHAPFAVTHAQRMHLKFSPAFDPSTIAIPDGLAATMRGELLYAVYVLGTVTTSAGFIPDTKCPPIEVNLHRVPVPDFTRWPAPPNARDQQAQADAINHNAAISNLLSAGVAPTPGAPHTPMSVPSKLANHFTEADYDAVAATRHIGLSGTVV